MADANQIYNYLKVYVNYYRNLVDISLKGSLIVSSLFLSTFNNIKILRPLHKTVLTTLKKILHVNFN